MLLFVQVKRWVTATFWIIAGGVCVCDYAADRKSMASGKSESSPAGSPPLSPSQQGAAWAHLTGAAWRS